MNDIIMRYSLLAITVTTFLFVTSCTPYYGTVRHNREYPNQKTKHKKAHKRHAQEPIYQERSAIEKTPEPAPPGKSKNKRFRSKKVAKQTQDTSAFKDIPVISLNRHEELPRVEDLKPEDITETTHYNTDVIAQPMNDITESELAANNPVGNPPCPGEDVNLSTFPCDPNAHPTMNDYLNAALNGDAHAAVKLGEIYLHGDGVPVDLHKAVEWYTKAAYAGVPLAQVQMGDFYRDGLGVKKNNREAIDWYSKAAHQGDVKAMINLGEMYKGWYGNPPNRNLAFKWYRQAASLGSDEAQTQIHMLLAANNVNANVMDKMEFGHSIQHLTALAQAGNVKAMMELGDRYNTGKGVRRNVSLAVQYYKSAAKLGSAEGAYKAADIYFWGKGIKADSMQALVYYKRAGDLGMAEAKYKAAQMYFKGEGIPRSIPLAKDWYLKAADQNYPPAQAAIADMYMSGMGVPRYYPRAFYWYDLAAKHGDTYAKFMLSILYAKGQGIDLDLAKSVEWYNRADQQEDNLAAQTRIGKNYTLGFAVPKDGAEAVRWLSLAATEGYAPAQADLGDLLTHSDLVAPNYPAAVEWYTLAATNGLPYGQYSLGLALLEGRGVDQDAHEAVSWLKKAAYQGYRPAQYELGRLYYDGHYIKRNDVRAYGWWSLSLLDMNDITPESLALLIERMEPGYRERAVLLAERYQQRYGAISQREAKAEEREYLK